jgi:hypothetical protein
MAAMASILQNSRPLMYSTLDDLIFHRKFETVHRMMVQRDLRTKDLMRLLQKYSYQNEKRHLLPDKVFDFLKQELL